jgi:hypothetical protein
MRGGPSARAPPMLPRLTVGFERQISYAEDFQSWAVVQHADTFPLPNTDVLRTNLVLFKFAVASTRAAQNHLIKAAGTKAMPSGPLNIKSPVGSNCISERGKIPGKEPTRSPVDSAYE